MGKCKMYSPEYESYLRIENERLQERKEAARRERLKWIRDMIIAIILGIIIGIITEYGNIGAKKETTAPQTLPSVSVRPVESKQTKLHEAPTAKGSWKNSTKPHDITVNTILKYDGNAIYNFGKTVAVGICEQNDIVSTAETESGFILSVTNDDSVKVTFYNNGTDYIMPTKLIVQMPAKDYVDETGKTEYIIKGYKNCTNGFGKIQMTLSNGHNLSCGVLRENGKLYAANFTTIPQIAENNVSFRLKMEPVLAKNNITPDNQTYTNPIYYPIVPASPDERTDVDFWVNKSKMLVKDNWTDAHKVEVLYRYIVDHFAYDYWVIGKGNNSRAFYHKDFTGKYATSKTNVGVCEDFATILAIMCRAQNIPATKVYTGKHAWSYVYIADYGRWMCIDATEDLAYNCYSEDTSKWTPSISGERYANFDNVSGNKLSMNCDAGIGNDIDMKRYGKIPVEMQ